MVALPTRLWRLSLENARAAGVGVALAAFLYTKLSAGSGGDVLDASMIVLPAIEFSIFALFVAVYRDSVAACPKGSKAFGVFALWFVVDFLTMSLWVVFVRAGIEAYVKLGAPPAFDFSV